MEYTYKIVKEDYRTGEQARRCRTITRYRPLEIGGLYFHLGSGFPGCYRVLSHDRMEKPENTAPSNDPEQGLAHGASFRVQGLK